MEVLRKLQTAIDNLSLRERGIVLGGIIIVTYFLFDLFLYQPVAANQKQLRNQVEQNNILLSSMVAQYSKLSMTSSGDLLQRDRQAIQGLRVELQKLDDELRRSTSNLVRPGQMADVLQQVLGRTEGLNLRRVTSLGSSPLLPPSAPGDRNQPGRTAGEPETAAASAYRHGLVLEFDGTFFSTLEYMKNLEQLEWKFFWDKIEYNVSEYPEAVGTLSIYTISLDKNWIGI